MPKICSAQGRDHGTAGILIIISVWCDLIGENCDENEKDQNDQSHQRLLVLFKTSPDFGEHTVIFSCRLLLSSLLETEEPALGALIHGLHAGGQ